MSSFRDAQGRYLRVPPGASPCYCCCRTVDVVFGGIETLDAPVPDRGFCGYRLGGSPNFAARLTAGVPFEPGWNDCCEYGGVSEGQLTFREKDDCGGLTRPDQYVTSAPHFRMRPCPPDRPNLSSARLYMPYKNNVDGLPERQPPPFNWQGVLPSPWGTSQVLGNTNAALCMAPDDPYTIGVGGTLTVTFPFP